MTPRFVSRDGQWCVQVVDLSNVARTPRKRRTDPCGDGQQLLVKRDGRLWAYVRTPAELAEVGVDLAELYEEKSVGGAEIIAA